MIFRIKRDTEIQNLGKVFVLKLESFCSLSVLHMLEIREVGLYKVKNFLFN